MCNKPSSPAGLASNYFHQLDWKCSGLQNNYSVLQSSSQGCSQSKKPQGDLS